MNFETGPSTDGALEPISVRVPQAVRLTGLSRSRIYELMKSGEIEFVKVGASTLILVESLRAYIVGRRR
ncbi:helix-turn-helix domain-containing protein [Sphingosinicella terrae]|uniref:helix-turn-helix domain-containing protein n=1 Tax=Sphingosinicella terrae TaxID=2172047 RepID=UPI000E0D1A04|nr:helix-turn-helix domain-containing protein [Sphingosinicella terrae]